MDSCWAPRSATLWALVFAAGCGGAITPQPEVAPTIAVEEAEAAPAPEPEGSAQDYAARITDYEGELDEALGERDAEAMQEGPLSGGARGSARCETAADLTERICELAARICSIAEAHPQDAELQDRCASATASCERAQHNLAAACE